MFVKSLLLVFISCVVLTGCSLGSSDSSGTSSEANSAVEGSVADAEDVVEFFVPDSDSGSTSDSVFDIPGASESSWTPFFVSSLVDDSTQYGAVGQVIVFDGSVNDASFRVVSGDSLEFVTNLVYDSVTYADGLVISGIGESAVEVFSKSTGDILFSFNVIS